MDAPKDQPIDDTKADGPSRRKREKALRFQAEALDRVNDAVIAIDREGVLFYWNSCAERLLSIPPDASEGIRLEDICTKIGGESTKLFALSTKEKPWREYRIRLNETDEEYYLESSATESPEEDGTPGGRLVVLRDVTARTKAENRLKRTNAELELFTSIASHDLQEPLRTVTLYMELLAKSYRGKLGEDADEFIGFAVDGAKRMKSLLDDLLLYARFQASGENFKRVSLNRVAANVVSDLQMAISESGSIVEIATLPEVIADEAQMRQVFQNLISNAIKFAEKGRTPVVSIIAESKPSEWIVSVKDNGAGFDMAYAEKIFELFKRLEVRTPTSGTGMGLTITKKIIEAHGGRIWVASTLGVGTTISFSIPR